MLRIKINKNASLLMEAYSKKIVDAVVKKFLKQNPALSSDVVLSYIKRFDSVRSHPLVLKHKNGNDILKWSFDDMEQFLDANFPVDDGKSSGLVYDKPPLFSDGSIEVYQSIERQDCILIKEMFEKRTGRKYSWCISRSDAANMFFSYRYGMKSTFYFIFDKSRDVNDRLHASVVYWRLKQGGQGSNEYEYYFANADNIGDTLIEWQQIIKHYPDLVYHEKEMKSIPPTDEEIVRYNIVKDMTSPTIFQKRYKEDDSLVDLYISLGRDLSPDKMRFLFDEGRRDLLNKYILIGNMCEEMPPDIFHALAESSKRYLRNVWHKRGYNDLSFDFVFYDKPLKNFNEYIENIKEVGSKHYRYNILIYLIDNLPQSRELLLSYFLSSEQPITQYKKAQRQYLYDTFINLKEIELLCSLLNYERYSIDSINYDMQLKIFDSGLLSFFDYIVEHDNGLIEDLNPKIIFALGKDYIQKYQDKTDRFSDLEIDIMLEKYDKEKSYTNKELVVDVNDKYFRSILLEFDPLKLPENLTLHKIKLNINTILAKFCKAVKKITLEQMSVVSNNSIIESNIIEMNEVSLSGKIGMKNAIQINLLKSDLSDGCGFIKCNSLTMNENKIKILKDSHLKFLTLSSNNTIIANGINKFNYIVFNNKSNLEIIGTLYADVIDWGIGCSITAGTIYTNKVLIVTKNNIPKEIKFNKNGFIEYHDRGRQFFFKPDDRKYLNPFKDKEFKYPMESQLD